MPPARSWRRLAAPPAVATALLLATAIHAPGPLRASGAGATDALQLRFPLAYLLLAPPCDVLDAIALLSVRQQVALVLTAAIAGAAWRARAAWCGGVRCPFRMSGAAILGTLFGTGAIALGVLACTLAPRPMAALEARDPDIVVVDVHSHTSASHDGRPGFDVDANRRWHHDAGFDVAYVSDHATTVAAHAAATVNPALAGDGTVLLVGLEVHCRGQHLVVLAPTEPATTCAAATAARDTSAGPPIAILTVPATLPGVRPLPPAHAIETFDGSPRALDQFARHAPELHAIADAAHLAGVAGSNLHGWGRAAAAWTLLRIPGWRAMTPASLDRAIREALLHPAPGVIQVVERRRPLPPSSSLALAAVLPCAAWVLLRTLSPAERLAWLAWTWGTWALVLLVRRRRAAPAGIPAATARRTLEAA